MDMDGRIGGIGFRKIMAVLIVIILLISAIGVVFLLSKKNDVATSLQLVWLDQDEAYGEDEVTALADNMDTIFASARGIDGEKELFTVRAYDALSSQDLWATQIDLGAGINVALALDATETDVVAAGMGTYSNESEVIIIACFDVHNGSMIWNKTYDGGAGYNFVSDVECRGDMVFVVGSARNADGTDELLALAYDISNGSLAWSVRIDNGGGENAALALASSENAVLVTGYVENAVGCKDMFTASLDLQTGSEQWRAIYDAGQGDNRGTHVTILGDIVLMAGLGKVTDAYSMVIRAYGLVNGSLLWNVQGIESSAVNDMSLSEGRLIVTGVVGNKFFVNCYEGQDGRLLWQEQVLNLGMFNFRAAVDVENNRVCAAFFAQNISDEADYTWEINICQYGLNDGKVLDSNITKGEGKTDMNVDILIHGEKAFFTTSTEKIGRSLQFNNVSDSAGTNVAVNGRNITVNGENFIFKGVNYSPAPIGSNNAWCPWGDWFQPYWKGIYQRDIPKMAAMGVNVVKVYSMTGFAWGQDPNKNAVSHTDFYNELSEAGIYVIPSVYTTSVNINSYNSQNWDAQEFMKQWKVIVAEGKDNPAVLGWSFGNEVNTDTNLNNAAYWGKINDMLGHLKQMAPSKITIIPLQDQAESGGGVAPIRVHDSAMTNLDVWGVNSYRGLVNSGFDTLFTTHRTNSVKPLLITEFGPPETTRDSNGNLVVISNNAAAAGNYIKAHWTGHGDSIMNNIDVCSGGFIFEWTDEWYKKDGAPVTKQDPSTSSNGAFPGGWWDEEGFGMNAIALNNRAAESPDPGRPDILQPRAVVTIMTALWKA